jgi:hypothetical protein
MLPNRHDDNPYKSPQADVKNTVIDEQVDADYRGAIRGKRTVVAIICVLIGVSTVSISLSVAAGIQDRVFAQLAGLAVLIVQCVFLYRGLLWARTWLLLSLIVACVFSVIFTINLIADNNVVGTAIMGIYALLYGGIAVLILLSGSIREFLNSQLNDTGEDR